MNAPLKMSKSNDNTRNLYDVSADVKIGALESERNYWKTKYELFLKYGRRPVRFTKTIWPNGRMMELEYMQVSKTCAKA